MDGGAIASASASMRGSMIGNSSTMWRNTGVDVFSCSGRDNDDEEALKWAALEKLPTFDRLRKGLLFGSQGVSQEVDVDDLGYQGRKLLLERLIKSEQDNEAFLLKLRDRLDRVGIDLPTIEVRYDHLSIEAEAYVGSRALPSFTNFTMNIVEGLFNSLHILSSRKRKINILRDVSGIIKPCRLTLLLGPPASGKTTLLLALAGRLEKELKKTGTVTYNGHTLGEFVPQRTAAYVSQHDLHIGEMTVRETLEFSGRCQGVGTRYEMLADLARREKEANLKPDPDLDMFMKAAATPNQEVSVVTDYILKILGLEVCADTMVGDQMLRGISGGQKKRVTTGELLVGPATALFMDEISTGLDSSTTFSIVNSLRQYVHILKGTAFISLLQPAPETYDLFDDIVLISDGQIVYQGPREHVLEFFESMGFECPERKGVADFLQEVTSKKDQNQYWARRDEPYHFIPVSEFAEAFQSFHVARRLGDELATPFDKSKSHPAALTTERYGVNKKELLKACTSRELLLMKRNSFVYYFKLFQLTILALLEMSLFLRTKMHHNSVNDGQLYVGAIFFTIMVMMFNGMSEMALTIFKLPVFFKQRDLLFYPSWAYALPTWVLKIPISLVEAVVWIVLTYYEIGLDPNITRFLKHYLLLLLVHQTASGLFRFVGAMGRDMIVANTFGSFTMLILVALSGIILSRNDVKSWWIWGYWASPLMYAQNALLVNEFAGYRWNKPGPIPNETLGTTVVKSRGSFPDAYWYWLGAGALIGFTILFNIAFIVSLTYLNPFGKSHAAVGEDENEQNNVEVTERRTVVASQEGDQLRRRSSSSGSSSTRRNAIIEATENKKKGMILPFEPHSLTFYNIKYSVDMPAEMKYKGVEGNKLVLLNSVSGSFRPGVLTALMGVSGAGKTTLMDVLAGRKTGGYIEGDIKISGYPKKQETFARISGYCEQNDIHSPHVTVYESLVYSAWLRLPSQVDYATRKLFVDEVMELVELTPLRGALVGLPGVNGLSTEQRKRLTIAVELVANPSIIFMDEPTSGLDARAAAIVMRAVRNTVDTGRTVVCTIHQPSIDIFEAFDELFLMKHGGQEIYVGPLGRHSSQLIKYFESIDGVRKITKGYNPATWMLEVSSAVQEKLLGVDFADIYKNSELIRRNKALNGELGVPRSGSQDIYFETQYSQSFITQCIACLWKQHRSYWRNTSYTAVRFWFTTFIGLIFGSMYWNLGHTTSNMQDLFNATGSMFIAVLFLGILNASSVQPVVVVERTVFYRERGAGMYSAFPYAFGQAVIELPYVFAQAIVYGVIVYAMFSFEWTITKFLWFIFFMYFTLMYFTFYGMMSVALTPNQHIAAIVASMFYGIWNIFAGFLIPGPRIPIWLRWYYYGCPVAWTLYGLIVSQFGNVQDKLEDSNETVQQVLENYFGFKHDFIGVCATMVLFFVVAFGVTFAYSIKAFNFQRR